MRIAVGSDHRGRDAQAHIVHLLKQAGHEVRDMMQHRGRFHQSASSDDDAELPASRMNDDTTAGGQACDYPDVAYPVALAVADGDADTGILVCGTGIGMCIAANKVHGVRAALVHDHIGASIARRHNDANVLCISGELLGPVVIDHIIDAWLNTNFEGGRHARRVAKINAIERGLTPAQVEAIDAVGDTVSADT